MFARLESRDSDPMPADEICAGESNPFALSARQSYVLYGMNYFVRVEVSS